MQILSENASEGRIRLRIESGDDLWELSHIISAGDLVKTRTERKIQLGEDRSKQVRKAMILQIEVTDITFQHQVLRINGTITEGPDDLISYGDHHGLTLDENADFELTKKWDSYTRERLNQAVNAKRQKSLVTVFDRQEAIIAELGARGHNVIQTLKGDVAKKQEGGGEENFWKTIAESIKEVNSRKEYDRIIIASPAFWTDYLLDELPEEIKKKTTSATIGTVDPSAINELLRRPELKQTLAEDQSAQEQKIVDEILEAVSKDLACYGNKDVEKQGTLGRVEMVAATTTAVEKAREEGNYKQLDAAMETAKSTGAKVHLLRHVTDQIDSLGGIAGVLRW